MRSQQMELSGWGKYPAELCSIYRPERIEDLREIMRTPEGNTLLPRGLGRSYGDNAINGGNNVILSSGLNRLLSFDEETGLLECEGGVSFEDIITVFLPRGWFLPVTPGTKYVTVGGAIANDVHGKNHHRDGTISQYILQMSILVANGTIVTCSPQIQPTLFWATIGGIGLTGMILSAKIKLLPVESSSIEVDYHKARNLDHAFELFEASDSRYQYSVAWIDCLAKGSELGRSVLMRGNHASLEKLKYRANQYALGKKSKINIPFNLPSFCLNPLSIKLFNNLYHGIHKDGATAISSYNSYFYPLDAINNWNRMYGKRGFVQYQFVFPPQHSREGLLRILEKLSSAKCSSFLAVLKSFGDQNKGLLSFPTKGYTLALDIPFKDESLIPFLHSLDDIVLKFGGRIYLAKDAVVKPESIQQMYPHLDAFREVLSEWDPQGLWSSSQARRIQIVR